MRLKITSRAVEHNHDGERGMAYTTRGRARRGRDRGDRRHVACCRLLPSDASVRAGARLTLARGRLPSESADGSFTLACVAQCGSVRDDAGQCSCSSGASTSLILAETPASPQRQAGLIGGRRCAPDSGVLSSMDRSVTDRTVFQARIAVPLRAGSSCAKWHCGQREGRP